MRLNGYALFSTASGNVNESKQLIKQKTSQDIKGDRAADMKILTTLAKYLWLKDNLEFRLRVVAALGFLVGAKVYFRSLVENCLIAVIVHSFLYCASFMWGKSS